MAAVVVNPGAETTAAWEKAGCDLKFLFDKNNVDTDIQTKFFHIGVTTVKEFASFCEDKAELRQVLKDSFSLDIGADLGARVKASKVIVAYDAAKARSVKIAEAEGEAEARNVPKEVSSNDTQAMRASFETRYWDLGDREVPGRSYIEKKLDEIERGELRAEPLTEVLSREEDDPDTLRAICLAGGEFKAMKVGAKVALPGNTETLRKRLALLGVAWMFLGNHQSNRGYLKGLTPQVFQEYASYLLGEYVLGMLSIDGGNAAVSSPSWAILLAYEHAVRVRAVLHVRKGMTFVAALRASWEDPLVKERHFSTPLAMEFVKGKSSGSHGLTYPPGVWETQFTKPKPAEGTGKGKGKGSLAKQAMVAKRAAERQARKGTAKGTAKANGCNISTPGGKPICFKFNAGGCSDDPCRFLHACGKCFKMGTSMSSCGCH